MTEKRNKRKHAFAGAMLIYALVVLALLIVAVRPLWAFLSAYEESSSDKAMQRYIQSFDEEHVRAVAQPFLDGLDLGLQSREQAFQAVVKSMSGPLSYALRSTEADMRHETYAIRSGDRVVGSVSIGKEEDPSFGFSPWEVESESFDFSWLLGGDEITVPEGWTVLCNGTVLDESYRSGETARFELLKDFYADSRFTLPYLVSYRVEGIVGEAPFTMLDAGGREVALDAGLSEEQMLANCSEDEEQQLRTLLDGFLQRYIDCLSNASRNARGNYEALKPYILAGSDIDSRIYDNIAGQQWAHSKGDTVLERTDKLLMDLGNGYYLADISYRLDTVGEHGHVESVNQARIIISMTASGPRVIEVYTY